MRVAQENAGRLAKKMKGGGENCGNYTICLLCGMLLFGISLFSKNIFVFAIYVLVIASVYSTKLEVYLHQLKSVFIPARVVFVLCCCFLEVTTQELVTMVSSE